MRKIKKLYTSIGILIVIVRFADAQNISTINESVYTNDSVVIRLNDYTGYLQWQKSTDNSNWTDIANANSDTLLFIADQTTYFRASVTAGTCEPFFSDLAKISVDTTTVETGYQLTINYPGVTAVGMNAIFIAWVEDEEGNNIQNLYICNKIKADMTTSPGTLLGVALPYWSREKSASIEWDNVDGITGASTQTATGITRTLSAGEITKIRVCFEIDRSANENDYFTDRPCFIYKSELIDLTALEENYTLNFEGFMANDTEHGTYGQTPPLQNIPGFEVWKFIPDATYVAPRNMFIDETEENSNLTVVIEEL